MRAELSSIVALTLALACSGGAARPAPSTTPAPAPRPPAPRAHPAPPLEQDTVPDGPACEANDDCEQGRQCRGPAGCEADFACGAPRECGADTVSYCGCDGLTFYAPSNCPGRAYRSVGACDALGEVVDDEPAPVEGSAICTSSDDCGRRQVCVGTEGCATYWTCERRWRVRPRCTRRQAHFCSCDGETFEASATCPGRPFLHPGYCAGDEPEPEASEEPPARTEAAPAAPASNTPSRPAPAAPEPRSPRQAWPPAAPSPAAPATFADDGDCPRPQRCQGEEGCGAPWHCGPPRRQCVRDTQYFCGCDGETFTASMTCPNHPYRHRGSCTPEERASSAAP